MANDVYFLRARRLDTPPHSKGWSRVMVASTEVWVRDEELIPTGDPVNRLSKRELATRLCVVANCGDVSGHMVEVLRQAASYLEEDDVERRAGESDRSKEEAARREETAGGGGR